MDNTPTFSSTRVAASTPKFDALFVADSIAAATGDIASQMARSDHFEVRLCTICWVGRVLPR